MLDPRSSPLFEAWTNSETGLEVWLLSAEPAPLQQSFYFVNDGLSRDGRYLWFYCAYPPSGSGNDGRTLAVVDSEAQTVHRFPDTQFQAGSPFVDPDSGEVYWTTGASIWRRGPQPEAEAECVNSLPADVLRNRRVARLATHLSRSADGREFFVDVWVSRGAELVFGTLPLDGGDFQFWHSFDRHHNHAQFSPVDPDMVLFAQEGHTDLHTGLRTPITNRMWTIRRGEAPRPVFEDPTVCSHEWWDADGVHAWSVRRKETWRTNVQTGELERIEWPVTCLHAHSSVDGRYLVCDSSTERFYRGCATSVHFMDRRTGKTLKLIDNPAIEGYVGANYHIDPHPRFCCGDRFVVFTATVRGRVDVAVVRTDDLVAWVEEGSAERRPLLVP